MKRFVLLPLLFLYQFAIAQQMIPCQARVFLDFDYCDYIPVYESSDAASPQFMIRNLCDDDKYVEIQITGKKGTRLRVNLSFTCLGSEFEVHNAYIQNRHLVALSRMQENAMPLFERPSDDGKIVCNVESSYGYAYQVLDCTGTWLKVSYVDSKGERHVGWMAERYQCSNPYTACLGM